eukprot:CAMPEP_0205923582 /NCGR_PEP_ID=MMETSP1325-20131115/16459_1 /ASSEMBLY_ACC=CAM_ASM_000708 /TAXON_ID=236786 /ORGANISM="Florenciella sp., Strain RCC1007" /LENGTH=159 /DNA_ID=CAMNT_0053291821 /DNA_START=33 /DNA_END=512 /DNA_ORIENTATION=+
MATCPDSLTWMLVKKQNCFLQKRNGNTKRSGTVVLSSEPGNLKNLNSYKYSGLCNSKAIKMAVEEEETEGKTKVTVSMGLKIKKNCGKKPSKSWSTIPLNKDFRRTAKCIKSQTVAQAYRTDLTDAALARWAALHRFAKVKKGLAKPAVTKKGRGGKDE